MPSISGSFSGKITQQFGLPLNDQSNHLLAIAEVNGTQNSPDTLWNDSKITYWGINDLLNGEGTQTGYFNNPQERPSNAAASQSNEKIIKLNFVEFIRDPNVSIDHGTATPGVTVPARATDRSRLRCAFAGRNCARQRRLLKTEK